RPARGELAIAPRGNRRALRPAQRCAPGAGARDPGRAGGSCSTGAAAQRGRRAPDLRGGEHPGAGALRLFARLRADRDLPAGAVRRPRRAAGVLALGGPLGVTSDKGRVVREAMRRMENPLLPRLRAREARIGVVGMGYVGLPLGMAFAEAGFQVLGLETDAAKRDAIGKGESYIKHIPTDALRPLCESGKLSATGDFSRVRELDVVVICVPTPLTSSREPDMRFIRATGEALGPHVRNGQLFVLESTTYPGTTDEVLRPLLEAGGLKAGVDFHLAFSPEREDPGNARFNTRTIPKVVGGHTPECLEVATELYASALEQVVPVS